jgi:hypothetical protein
MESLLVLGLVPGTNIQITFAGWLLVGVAIFLTALLLYMKRRHILMFFMLGLRLRRQLAQLDVQKFSYRLG